MPSLATNNSECDDNAVVLGFVTPLPTTELVAIPIEDPVLV